MKIDAKGIIVNLSICLKEVEQLCTNFDSLDALQFSNDNLGLMQRDELKYVFIDLKEAKERLDLLMEECSLSLDVVSARRKTTFSTWR